MALLAVVAVTLLVLHSSGGEIERFKAGDEAENVTPKSYWSPMCPYGFSMYWSAQNIASVCYYVSSVKQDWTTARDSCRSLANQGTSSVCRGDLASVMNSAENDFILDLMDHLGISDHAWLGYNDIWKEGQFEWSDGRRGTWSRFYPGEPNNGGATSVGDENCIEVMNLLYGYWNDRDCSHQKYFVCKAYCV